MKAIEQYFPVLLFIVLYTVVLNFESVHEILKCDHSIESNQAVLSCATVHYAVVLTVTTQKKATEHYYHDCGAAYYT